MASHDDRDFIQAIESNSAADVDARMETLVKRGEEMTARGENKITAGKPGEALIGSEVVGMFTIRRLPKDDLCDRISIGSPRWAMDQSYIVTRQSISDTIELMERALSALKVSRMEVEGK